MNKASDLVKQKENLLNVALRQQNEASDPNVSVWVEASAGTGKTKVLTDRVLRLLLSGVQSSKILCLTYTKAAAVEMNSRVFEKLSKWAVLPKKELLDELKALNAYCEKNEEQIIETARTLFARVLDAPTQIKIQTIHGFCEQTLKRFPLEAGVSPYFEVMDDRASSEALKKISQNFLKKADEIKNKNTYEALLYLAQNVKGFDLKELLSTLRSKQNKLIEVLSNYENFASFLSKLRHKLNLDENETKGSVFEVFENQTNKKTLLRISEILEFGTKTDIENAFLLKNLAELFDFEAYQSLFLTKTGEQRAKFCSKEIATRYPEVIEFFDQESDRILKAKNKLQDVKIYEATKAVMSIAESLIHEYVAYKKRNAFLDYEDLIMLTKNLLSKSDVSSWVLYKLDGGISHILIDEAQDTSPSQWAIVKALTDEFFSGVGQKTENRTVFAVGDRKQSIYSFQGADPQKFDEMRSFYLNTVQDFKTLHLDVSFRSTNAILETVNHLFEYDDASKGVANEDGFVKHLPFRMGEAGKVEIFEIEETKEDDGDDSWYPPVEMTIKTTASERLALKIASKIKEMVQNKEILKSKNRPICYGDFMVLVQRRNAFVEQFVRACKKLGINISGVDKLALLDQLVVEDLISFAKFLLLPFDDLSLAEILKSPLFNLSDKDLFELCYNRKDKSLWESLKENLKFKKVAEELSAFLLISDYQRPFEIFSTLLSQYNGRKKIFSRLGKEAGDALDEFMNLTLEFERTNVPNLQNFVVWLEKENIEIKREMDQGDSNIVRIMTVHASKGLQAPIVILPDTLRLPKTNKSGDMIFDDHLVYFPMTAKDYNKTCEDLHEKMKDKAYEEYRRLLYVALTRAEDRLYITGYGKKNEGGSSWYDYCKRALKEIGKEAFQNTYVFETENEIPIKEDVEFDQNNVSLKIPNWIDKEAPVESPISKPYTPSHLKEDEETPVSSPLIDGGRFYKRGTLIHKLLQHLTPEMSLEEKKKFMHIYLQKEPDFSESAKKDIEDEVNRLLLDENLSFIFSRNARAEVSVMGEVEGKIISAQIDRLIVFEDKVIIVDFKTNRPAASTQKEIPEAYINQMDVYQKLIKSIYPNKTVESYILWTNSLKLMKI